MGLFLLGGLTHKRLIYRLFLSAAFPALFPDAYGPPLRAQTDNTVVNLGFGRPLTSHLQSVTSWESYSHLRRRRGGLFRLPGRRLLGLSGFLDPPPSRARVLQGSLRHYGDAMTALSPKTRE